jgi:hypothetical protein
MIIFFIQDSSAIYEDGMDRTHIVTLAKNILHFTNILVTYISIPDVNLYLLYGKEIYQTHNTKNLPSFVWTHLLPEVFRKVPGEWKSVNTRCPNKDCNKDIETFLSLNLFKEKESQEKATTSTAENTATKQIDSENLIPIGKDANEIYMNFIFKFNAINLIV